MFNFGEKAIEGLQAIFEELIDGFFDTAFGILKVFLLSPTGFADYPFISEAQVWIYGVSITIGIVLLVYNLMKFYYQDMGGYAQRTPTEIVVKAVIATIFAGTAPVIVTEGFIRLNNYWVEGLIAKGVNTEAVKEIMNTPQNASLAISIYALAISILFIVLAIQYIIRLGELSIQLLFSSLAAYSMINEDINIWPIWWRETSTTVFQQAFQVTILWVIINLITGRGEGEDYLMAIGLMLGLLKGPGFLRTILYSTGAGKTMAGAAGGTAKMALYKVAARKMVK